VFGDRLYPALVLFARFLAYSYTLVSQSGHTHVTELVVYSYTYFKNFILSKPNRERTTNLRK